ncbi:MAG: hypothetical protein HUJ68_09225 [Clostridia bacterium]|nr:hypothetical protein [Clostridia bacterium]
MAKLTNKQRLRIIADELLNYKSLEINEKLSTFLVEFDSVKTDGKVAFITFKNNIGEKITYKFDKAKDWKFGEPNLESAHLI